MIKVKSHKRVAKNKVTVVRAHARNKKSKMLKEGFNLQQGAEDIYEKNLGIGRHKKRSREYESINDYSHAAIIRKGRQRNEYNQNNDKLRYPISGKSKSGKRAKRSKRAGY